MAETSTIFGFMKYVSATDILSDFKKTVDSYFVNSLRTGSNSSSSCYYLKSESSITIVRWISSTSASVNSLSCSRQNSIKMWELTIYNHSPA